jgi:hypothetical protein
MSNYESERASIVLPTSAVTPLKTMLRDYQNKLRDEVRAAVIEIHKSVGTRSRKLYQERWQQARYDAEEVASDWRHGRRDERKELVRDVAGTVIWHMMYRTEREGVAPQQPTAADLEYVLPKATNKTTRFPVFGRDGYSEADISFQGRTVIWEVGENNHAVDAARGTELAILFFRHLDRITWTRGTGGVGLYHSEYQDDSTDPNAHARSISFAYGPQGEKVKAQRMGVSVAKLRAMTQRTPASYRVSTRW